MRFFLGPADFGTSFFDSSHFEISPSSDVLCRSRLDANERVVLHLSAKLQYKKKGRNVSFFFTFFDFLANAHLLVLGCMFPRGGGAVSRVVFWNLLKAERSQMLATGKIIFSSTTCVGQVRHNMMSHPTSKFQCAGRGTRRTCITAADKSNYLPFLHSVQLQTSCRHFDILAKQQPAAKNCIGQALTALAFKLLYASW